jgi:hypothetical protein
MKLLLAPRLLALPLTLALCLQGCGSSSASGEPVTFPADALQTEQSNDGHLSFEIRTSPQPPARGVLSVQYRITSPEGAPLDGLTLTVIPWMPAMGHGTSTVPTVEARGNGLYVLNDVNLYMAGLWELRTRISGHASGEVTPRLQIP